MAGAVFFALAPFYQAAWKDAVYDGGLLIVAEAFLADAFSDASKSSVL